MTDREKLIEILKTKPFSFSAYSAGWLADHLLAHGVTVRELAAAQKPGHWIDKPTGRYGQMQSWCSACGQHSGIGGIESNRHKPFCPNCGAPMNGGTTQ